MKSIRNMLILVLLMSFGGVAGLSSEELLSTGLGSAPYDFALAKILVEEGDLEGASAAYERAIGEATSEPYLKAEFASFLLAAGKVEEALDQADRAVALAPEDQDILKAAAQLHLESARYAGRELARARSLYETLLEEHPDDLEGASTLGRIYMSEDRFSDAVAVFRSALTYWPQSRSLHGALVDSLLRSGEQAGASDALRDLLTVDRTAIRARLTLAQLLEQSGDEEGAAEILAQTPSESTAEPEVYRQLALSLYESGRAKEALHWLDKSMLTEAGGQKDGGETDVRGHFLRSLLLTQLGRAQEAVDQLRELVASHPGQIDMAQVLVGHLTAMEEFEEAVGVAESTLKGEVGPSQADLVIMLAEGLSRVERSDEALDWLARLQGVEGERPRALGLQAAVLFREGRVDEASAVLDALTSDGKRESLLLAAEVCQREERYSQAIPLLETLIADPETGPQPLFWLGAAYERTGQIASAEKNFRKFLELQPDSAAAMNYLGYMWADNTMRLDEALGLVTRAVELDPDNGAYIDSLGWVFYRLGDYVQAKGALEKAVELVDDDAVVFEHLGDVYAALGDARAAVSVYKRALDLGAEDPNAIEEKLRRLEIE